MLAAITAREIDPDDAYAYAADKRMFQKYVTDTSVLPKAELTATMPLHTPIGQIVLDLSQVTFMDLSGLRTLNAIERHVSTRGGSLRVAAVSHEVARLFELVGPRGALPHILAPPVLGGLHHAAAPAPGTLASASPSVQGAALELAGSAEGS